MAETDTAGGGVLKASEASDGDQVAGEGSNTNSDGKIVLHDN